MKTSKITYLFVALMAFVILSSAQVFSQKTGKDFKNKTPEERAKFQTNMMKSKLNLNTNQQAKVEAINLTYAKKFEPIIKSKDSRINRFKQAISLQTAKDAELKIVFSTEQYKLYEKFENELKGKIREKI